MAARGEVTVETVLAALKRAGTAKDADGHARFGIVAPKAFGVPMGEIQKLAKGYGESHELADKLWASGWYEARMMAAYVDEVDRITPAQMDKVTARDAKITSQKTSSRPAPRTAAAPRPRR